MIRKITTGFPTSWERIVIGRIAQLVVLFFWVGSVLFPVLAAVLLFFGHVHSGLALSFLLSLPYVLPIRRWPAFFNFVLRAGDAFESCELWLEEGFPGIDQPTFFVFSPHGVFSWGMMINAGLRPEIYPRKGLAASILVRLPLFRLFILWCDSIQSAGRAEVEAAMRRRESLGVMLGGFEEATLLEYGKHRVFHRNRKGFIKLSLQHGYRNAAVYTFGESLTYHNLTWFSGFRAWLGQFSIPGVLPWGVWWCPVLPIPTRIRTVMGTPWQLPKIENPTTDDIDFWHKRYLDELGALFNRHKAAFGEPDAVLEII